MRYHKEFLRRLRGGKMVRARYVGPRADLRGATALVRRAADAGPTVTLLCQFDDLKRFGEGGLAHGWRPFPAGHLKLGTAARRRT